MPRWRRTVRIACFRGWTRSSSEFRGFAFEGAGMGLFLLDLLTPWSRGRLRAFLAVPGHRTFTWSTWGPAGRWLSFGAIARALARFDPLLGWLAVDGYGFHQGYFHWRRSVDEHASPAARRLCLAGLRPGAGPEPLVRRGGRGRSDRRDDRPLPGRGTPTSGAASAWPVRTRAAWTAEAIEALSVIAGTCQPASRPGRGLRRQGTRAGRQSVSPHRPGLPDRLRDVRRGGRAADRRRPDRSAGRCEGSPPTRSGDSASRPTGSKEAVTIMTAARAVFRRHAARLVALAIIVALYGLARQPELSGTEQARLAGRFQLRPPRAAGALRRPLADAPAGPSQPEEDRVVDLRRSARRWRSTTWTATACPTTSSTWIRGPTG